MNAKPILFSEPMIRALLDGRKTQTRRALNPQPPGNECRDLVEVVWGAAAEKLSARENERRSRAWAGFSDSRAPGSVAYYGCPYGRPGDLLWVRETHMIIGGPDAVDPRLVYRASDDGSWISPVWRPSIHMPRWASRLTLRITDVRVERLQEISEADARAEGVSAVSFPGVDDQHSDIDRFRALCNRLNGDGSWTENPWVWALSFEVIHANVDEVLKRGVAA